MTLTRGARLAESAPFRGPLECRAKREVESAEPAFRTAVGDVRRSKHGVGAYAHGAAVKQAFGLDFIGIVPDVAGIAEGDEVDSLAQTGRKSSDPVLISQARDTGIAPPQLSLAKT